MLGFWEKRIFCYTLFMTQGKINELCLKRYEISHEKGTFSLLSDFWIVPNDLLSLQAVSHRTLQK